MPAPTALRLFLILTMVVLPASIESRASTLVYQAGVIDDFALPADPVTPSSNLVSLLPSAVQPYDLIAGVTGSPDRQVAHTFTQLPSGIIAASLQIRVRAGNDSGVLSDGIILTFCDGTQSSYSSAVIWARPFGQWAGGGIYGPAPDPGLLKSTAWSIGDDRTFTLDLSALPLNGGGSLDLIPQLNGEGFLDVNVSDETAVDFAILTLEAGPILLPDVIDLTVDVSQGSAAWMRPFGRWPGSGIFGPAPDPGLLKSTPWSSGDDVTFTLDLSALPLNGGGTRNLIADLNSHGFLDANVSDETGVDYAILTMTTVSGPVVLQAGVADGFALPADPVSPGPDLIAILSTGVQAYDLIAGVNGGSPDLQVVHTFTPLPAGILAATLEMRVRAGSVGDVNSDGIILSFVDGSQAEYFGGGVSLSWQASCMVLAVDFEIYEGSIGDYYSHGAVACSTGGHMSATVDPMPGNRYFLAVSRNALGEGSYGLRGDGGERAQGAPACLHQASQVVCP